MHTRFLPIFFGVAFALTLFFVVAAGAQEKSTGGSLGGGGGVQVQKSQSVQQQVEPAAAPAPFGGPLAHEPVKVTKGGGDDVVDKNDVLKITGDYDVKAGASITIEDADGTQATFVDGVDAKITETDNGIEIEVTKEPTTVRSEAGSNDTLDIDNLRVVTSTDVQRAGSGSGGNNGGNNNGGSSGTTSGTSTGTDTTGTTGVTPAQSDTTGTTTAETTTANDTLNSLAETTTANNANGSNSDNFRCESFLHVVRDDNGALRNQYRGNQLVEHRVEQCLSGDVLTNTIPNRRLPFTGGPPLPLAGGLLLLVALAVLAGRIIRR